MIDYTHYRDRAQWDRDFRAFIENERPIVQALAEPTPLITVQPDRELIALFRGHRQSGEAGDVEVHHLLSCDVPKPEARLAIKFTWSQPTAYTMTLLLSVPQCLDWLTPALRRGTLVCSIVPRPDLGLIVLPLPDDLPGQLVMLATSIIYHLERRRRR